MADRTYLKKSLLFVITLLLVGCNPPDSKSSTGPTNSKISPTRAPVTNAPTGQDVIENFSIPSNAENPPTDIMDHVVFYGVGGGEGACPCYTIDGNNIVLSKFKANTNYRIVVYKTSIIQIGQYSEEQGVYWTHWNITTNSKGSMSVTMDKPLTKAFNVVFFDMAGNIAARKFGIREFKEVMVRYTERAISPCNTYPTRLRLGGLASVNRNPDIPNNVRKSWGTRWPKLGQVFPGERLKITDGPVCADDMVWWKIESTKTGLVGWTSEGDGNNYWLVPEN